LSSVEELYSLFGSTPKGFLFAKIKPRTPHNCNSYPSKTKNKQKQNKRRSCDVENKTCYTTFATTWKTTKITQQPITPNSHAKHK
jgi:hypothetical protein